MQLSKQQGHLAWDNDQDPPGKDMKRSGQFYILGKMVLLDRTPGHTINNDFQQIYALKGRLQH